MKFPAYVPQPVRDYIFEYLKGDKNHEWCGAELTLDKLKKQLLESERNFKAIKQNNPKDKKLIEVSQAENSKLRQSVDAYSTNIDFMNRIAFDERMQEAYALLTSMFHEENRFKAFFSCAWSAVADYQERREDIRKAKDLKKEVSKTARKLARLLYSFREFDISPPLEFMNISTLLDKAEHKNYDEFSVEWENLKQYAICPFENYLNKKEYSELSNSKLSDFEQKRILDEIDMKMYMAWSRAPNLREALNALAVAADDFEPSFSSESIIAGTASRKNNIKTDYIRAFAVLLTDREFALTAELKRCIAIVSNVVINSPDIDVDYDAVRKVIKAMEDSNKK